MNMLTYDGHMLRTGVLYIIAEEVVQGREGTGTEDAGEGESVNESELRGLPSGSAMEEEAGGAGVEKEEEKEEEEQGQSERETTEVEEPATDTAM